MNGQSRHYVREHDVCVVAVCSRCDADLEERHHGVCPVCGKRASLTCDLDEPEHVSAVEQSEYLAYISEM